jgi:hypothetical protein
MDCYSCNKNHCCPIQYSTLPCNIVIRDFTQCPQKCYQVYVPSKINIFNQTFIPAHYELICNEGETPQHPPTPTPTPTHTPQHPPTPNIIGGCSGTRYGCCADGITSKTDEQGLNCSKIEHCYSSCPYKCNDNCIHYNLRKTLF